MYSCKDMYMCRHTGSYCADMCRHKGTSVGMCRRTGSCCFHSVCASQGVTMGKSTVEPLLVSRTHLPRTGHNEATGGMLEQLSKARQ